MPSGFSKGLRKTVSRTGKSIRGLNDEELPGSSAETQAGNTSARTADYSGSAESLHTVAPTAAASGPNLSDLIPDPHTKASLHSQEPDTVASDLFPSTNDSSARSGAPSGGSQIKLNQVQVSAKLIIR